MRHAAEIIISIAYHSKVANGNVDVDWFECYSHANAVHLNFYLHPPKFYGLKGAQSKPSNIRELLCYKPLL